MRAEEINSLRRNSASGHVIKHSCIIIHTRRLFYPSSTIPCCIVLQTFLGKKVKSLTVKISTWSQQQTLCSASLETFPLSAKAKTHTSLGSTEYFVKYSTNLQCSFSNVERGMGSSWFIIWSHSDWDPNLAKHLLEHSISKAARITYLPKRSSIM